MHSANEHKTVSMPWGEHQQLLSTIERKTKYIQDLLVNGKHPVIHLRSYGYTTYMRSPVDTNSFTYLNELEPTLCSFAEIDELEEEDKNYQIQQTILAVIEVKELQEERDELLKSKIDITQKYTNLYAKHLKIRSSGIYGFVLGSVTVGLVALLTR